jgi:hypothetical protein
MVYLPNYPGTVDVLSDEERAAVVTNLSKQASTIHAKTFDFVHIKSLFNNLSFLSFTMIWVMHGTV